MSIKEDLEAEIAALKETKKELEEVTASLVKRNKSYLTANKNTKKQIDELDAIRSKKDADLLAIKQECSAAQKRKDSLDQEIEAATFARMNKLAAQELLLEEKIIKIEEKNNQIDAVLAHTEKLKKEVLKEKQLLGVEKTQIQKEKKILIQAEKRLDEAAIKEAHIIDLQESLDSDMVRVRELEKEAGKSLQAAQKKEAKVEGAMIKAINMQGESGLIIEKYKTAIAALEAKDAELNELDANLRVKEHAIMRDSKEIEVAKKSLEEREFNINVEKSRIRKAIRDRKLQAELESEE